MNTTTTDLVAELNAAREAIKAGEAAGLSERTMNKKYKRFFAAEDALKAAAGRWF